MDWEELHRKARVYLIPAIIFQSVLIGGGYATGREIVSYVAKFGANGIWAAITCTIGFTFFLVLMYEFARKFEAYDYRTMMKNLLHKGYWAFDALYIVMMVLVIAVLASAAGSMWVAVAGIPYYLTVGIVVIVGGLLCFYGRKWLLRFKLFGTIGIYAWQVLQVAVVVAAIGWGPSIHTITAAQTGMVQHATVGSAMYRGFLYVMYNLVVFFAILYVLPAIKSRKEAILSGIVSGTLGTVPLWATYFCYMGFYPSEEVLGAPVPWLAVLNNVAPWIIPFFAAVLMWTITETNAGLVHAVNERIDIHLKDSGLGKLARWQRGAVALVIFIGAIFLTQYGVITLIAKGYTYMAYGFMLLFALPLATIGIFRIWKPDWAKKFWEKA